jgi:hypothetical protein
MAKFQVKFLNSFNNSCQKIDILTKVEQNYKIAISNKQQTLFMMMTVKKVG